MYSLRKRIGRNLTLNLLLVMAGLLFAFYFVVQQLMHDYIVTRLRHDADSLASVVYRDPDGNWRVESTRMSTVYNRVRSGHYYYVAIAEQTIVSRSLFDAEFPGVGEGGPSAYDYLAAGPGDERWLVWHQAVTRDGQEIGIWTAENIAPIRNRLLYQLLLIAGMIAAVVALLVYLQQRTLRNAFGVFEWLRLNLATIRQKEIENSGMTLPLEVAPLVAEIEKLVEQLRHRIVRTRHAMGNLAHELKRPLQLLSIQADNGQDEKRQAMLEEIRQILERELRRARISGSAAVGDRFDVAAELDAMTEVLRKIYPGIDIGVEYENETGTLDLDRDDMLELIGNLFDNACKFAGSRARLTFARADGHLDLVFEDDGAGLEPEQIQQLNRRGVRLDETVAGHGLGLGICRDILGYYHGSLGFARSGLGGLRACARIPLSSAAGESGSG
jgi:signal transduction histidine kinase